MIETLKYIWHIMLASRTNKKGDFNLTWQQMILLAIGVLMLLFVFGTLLLKSHNTSCSTMQQIFGGKC